MKNAVSMFLIAAILLIIVPLPAAVLDVMFILNLGLSLIILLITMYITEPLQFSVFPSVLLITTVFRLALNIAAARRILAQNGDAGQVIRAFGQFVIQGNVIIGFVIFIIGSNINLR